MSNRDKFIPRPGVRWDYDLTRRKYAPRQVPLPAPTVGILDDPTECITVNAEWFSHLLGAISALEQPDAWAGDDDERYRALQEIEKLIASVAPCEPCESQPPVIPSPPVLQLPECVEFLDCDGDGIAETINIYECQDECMVTVNIYEGCGCGG